MTWLFLKHNRKMGLNQAAPPKSGRFFHRICRFSGRDLRQATGVFKVLKTWGLSPKMKVGTIIPCPSMVTARVTSPWSVKCAGPVNISVIVSPRIQSNTPNIPPIFMGPNNQWSRYMSTRFSLSFFLNTGLSEDRVRQNASVNH